jgi:hypothetical protein
MTTLDPSEAPGAGKYADLCSHVRQLAEARGAIVMIFEGNKGTGFSIEAPGAAILALPFMMRALADDIEARIRKYGGPAGYLEALTKAHEP